MYARKVTMRLKPNAVEEFTRTLAEDIVPLLREQSGFADELTFLGSDGTEAVAISLWDRKESADAYNQDSYLQVLRLMATVIEGMPVVEAYEVSTSTFHTIPPGDCAGGRGGGRLVYLNRLSDRVRGGKLGWSGGHT